MERALDAGNASASHGQDQEQKKKKRKKSKARVMKSGIDARAQARANKFKAARTKAAEDDAAGDHDWPCDLDWDEAMCDWED